MKTITYNTTEGKKTYQYDENAPCIICGEPVIAASMGGTVVCPWCDLGKCRYCKIPIFVLKEELDDGRSKKELLDHMKWHREQIALHERNKKPGENMCSGLGQQDLN